MIWHEIHHHLQPHLVRALYQCFPFAHAVIHVVSDIRIDIVIVADGVWRAGNALHHVGVLLRYAVFGIISCRSMPDDASVPDMCDTQVLDSL